MYAAAADTVENPTGSTLTLDASAASVWQQAERIEQHY